MKYGIINSSDLGDRWDAGFHLLRTEHKERSEQISQQMPLEEAREKALEIFESLPLQFRKSIDRLTRTGSSSGNPNAESQRKAVAEYPYIALAVFEAQKTEILADLEAQAAEIEAKAAAVRAVAQQLGATLPETGSKERSA